jgi:glycosyltransferase involved in cell wall biosynthesis
MSRLTVLNIAYPFAPVAPATAGGAEQVLAMIDEALVTDGHRSLVLAAEGSQVTGELIVAGAVPSQLDGADRSEFRPRYKDRLISILRTQQVDVVHFHGLDFAEYFPDLGRQYLATIHLPPTWYSPETFELPVRFVWVSRDQYCASGARGGELIPNGICLEHLYPESTREDYVAAIGRICPEKGYHLALDAATACRRRLMLAGQAFPYPEHQTYFDVEIRPRLRGGHVFLGPVVGSSKRTLLARAHCVVIPSQVRETSSLVAMEALACGTPVVAMRVGALPEIVEHGRTGWLVGKPEDLPEAIEAAGQIRSADCRAAAEERFSARNMTVAYIRLYERLANAAGDLRRDGNTTKVVA